MRELTVPLLKISIHAAREGGDRTPIGVVHMRIISIHAAREGGDLQSFAAETHGFYFNPRRP